MRFWPRCARNRCASALAPVVLLVRVVAPLAVVHALIGAVHQGFEAFAFAAGGVPHRQAQWLTRVELVVQRQQLVHLLDDLFGAA